MFSQFRNAGLLALTVAALVLASTGCESSSVAVDAQSGLQGQIAELEREVNANPNDAELKRDLGALYLRRGRVEDAEPYLVEAHDALDDDPKTLFYLGLVREKQGSLEDAIDLFDGYDALADTARFRDLLHGRYVRLRRQAARIDVQERIRREEDIGLGAVDEEAVAVFPLQYRGGSQRYAPLARGMSEMIVNDLVQVERLTVVERIRLQALMDELKLARTDYVDPETAPRVGRLIGAGRLIGGSFSVRDDELNINVQVTQAASGEQSSVSEPQESLDEVFNVSNRIVFEIVDYFGIQLTAEEEAAIETVPTRNLEAFLSYSEALQAEDQGDFQRAEQLYRRAAQQDPSFQQAQQGASRSSAASEASPTVEQAATQSASQETGSDDVGPTGEASQSIDIKELRLDNMGVTTAPTASDDNPSEGDDSREPAAEGVAGDGSLPDPPDVPESGGGN